MEDRSSRRMRTLVTQMARRGLSVNEVARALISMMARSTTRSNQRPDTLMQDRICQVDETSCNARPDHTFGSKTDFSGTAASGGYCCKSRKSDDAENFAKIDSELSLRLQPSLAPRSGRSAVLNGPCVASASVCGLLANEPKGARRRLPTKVALTEAAVIRSPSGSKANLS